MDRKTNKNKRRKRNIDDFQIEQDENFSFIAGYTSGDGRCYYGCII